MRVFKPNKWIPALLMSVVFVLAMAFTNCSEMDFGQSGDAAEKPAGAGSGQAVEVIDTTGMDGEPLTEENMQDLKDELRHRQGRGDTEITYTDADGCGPQKVVVCHVPPGNPGNQHDICISVNALHAHADRHGVDGHRDHIGNCRDLFKIGDLERSRKDCGDHCDKRNGNKKNCDDNSHNHDDSEEPDGDIEQPGDPDTAPIDAN